MSNLYSSEFKVQSLKFKNMIDFKDITLEDKEIITSYIFPNDCCNCEFSFSNLISWRFLYNTKYAVVDDFLILFYHNQQYGDIYMMPIGKGNADAIVNKLIDDAQSRGNAFKMFAACHFVENQLSDDMKDKFILEPNRDSFDYVYNREDLATLKGNKFQQKRNHVNRFKKTYPNWEYKSATPELIKLCIEKENEWYESNDDYKHQDIGNERQALLFAMTHAEEIGVKGGVLFVDNKVVAFTFGYPINHKTFGVHFEKADINYTGAFTVINQMFANDIPEEFEYINREEDLGIEGLRKAKLSYNPEFLITKGLVELKVES